MSVRIAGRGPRGRVASRRLLAVVAAAAAVGAAGGCGGEGGGAATGGTGEDAAAVAYLRACEACHPQGGRSAGAGPVIAGKGLDAAAIATVLDDGKGTMPGRLLSGRERDLVAAYVLSLQSPP